MSSFGFEMKEHKQASFLLLNMPETVITEQAIQC